MSRQAKLIANKLARLPKRVEARLSEAMERQADIIVRQMKFLAPVGIDDANGKPPGTLRDSIGWTWGDAPGGSITIFKSAGWAAGDHITIYAGSKEAFYARWIEWGTVRMPPQSFFRVSWRIHRKKTIAAMKKAFRQAKKEIWNGN